MEPDDADGVFFTPTYYCATCDRDWHLEDLAELIDKADLSVDEVDCEHCQQPIEIGIDCCPHCATLLDEEYWRSYFKNWSFSSIDDYDYDEDEDDDLDYNVLTQKDLIRRYRPTLMLCCDKPFDLCECPAHNRLFWEDISMIDAEYYEKAYVLDESSDCIMCHHYFESSCIPFRNWARDTINGQKFQGSIEGTCENFLHHREGKSLVENMEERTIDYV